MFQPAEEQISGAKAMLAAGVLENPTVDAAIGLHVDPMNPVGGLMYNIGTSSYSADAFEITIHGEGCHGSTPHKGVDPINVGVHIYLAFQELIAREVSPQETAILTIGQFHSGVAANIMPSEAKMQGGFRTLNPEVRRHLAKRVREVADKIAEAYRATVTYTEMAEVPSIQNDPALAEEMLGYIKALDGSIRLTPNYTLNGSEDFACVSEKVPTFWMSLPAQVGDETYTLHSPFVKFNEEAMPLGAAVFAQCAFNWLKNHR
jgi:amidohydrolase